MLDKGQKYEILKLRKKGYGYKSISSILKIKRDTVRNVCKAYNLTGYGQPIEGDIEDLINIPKNCLYCGKEINSEERRGRKSKFCSDQCRRTWWSKTSAGGHGGARTVTRKIKRRGILLYAKTAAGNLKPTVIKTGSFVLLGVQVNTDLAAPLNVSKVFF